MHTDSAEPALGPAAIAALALLFCLLWSSAFIAGKIILHSSPPLLVLTLRFLIAGAILCALAGFRLPSGRSSWGLLLLLGLLNNTLYLGPTFYGLQFVPAGFAIVIASTNPIITAVLAHFLLAERLTRKKMLGLVLGIGGVCILMHQRLAAPENARELFGIALVALGTVSFACGTIVYRRFGAAENPLFISAWSTLLGGLALLPVALLLEQSAAIHWTWSLAAALGYLTVGVSIGAVLLWLRLIRLTNAGTASAFHFLNPFLGLLLAWLVLAEPVQTGELLGILPISAGIWLMMSARRTPSLLSTIGIKSAKTGA